MSPCATICLTKIYIKYLSHRSSPLYPLPLVGENVIAVARAVRTEKRMIIMIYFQKRSRARSAEGGALNLGFKGASTVVS